MPVEISLQPLEVFVDQRCSQFPHAAIDDEAFVDFHVQAVGGIVDELFKPRRTAAEEDPAACENPPNRNRRPRK